VAQPTQLTPTEQDALVKQIGLAMLRVAPDDWEQLTVDYRAVGRYAESTGQVTFADGGTEPWTMPADLQGLFTRLRAGMYREGRGTWFNARYKLDHPSSYNLEYDREEPAWEHQPPPQAYPDDMRLFPRTDDNVPEWLRRRLAAAPQLPSGPPPGTPMPDRAPGPPRFRVARVFDGPGEDGRPSVNRPQVDEMDIQDILDYLDNAPLVGPARGYDVDRLDPNGQQSVPIAFHTDGTWIWPAAVNYFLREHDVAPEPDLVEHIRRMRFQLPQVDDQTRAAAQLFLGPPPPGPRPGPLPPQAPVPAPTRAMPVPVPKAPPGTPRAALPSQGPATQELDHLRVRLEDLDVPETAYRIGQPAGRGWTMEQTDEGWRVGWHDQDWVAPAMFEDVADASAFLLGKLLLDTDRWAAGPKNPELPAPPAGEFEPMSAPIEEFNPAGRSDFASAGAGRNPRADFTPPGNGRGDFGATGSDFAAAGRGDFTPPGTGRDELGSPGSGRNDFGAGAGRSAGSGRGDFGSRDELGASGSGRSEFGSGRDELGAPGSGRSDFGAGGYGEPAREEFGAGSASGFGESGRNDFGSGAGGYGEPGRSELGAGGFGESGRGEPGPNGVSSYGGPGRGEPGAGAGGGFGESGRGETGRGEFGAGGAGGFGEAGHGETGRSEFGAGAGGFGEAGRGESGAGGAGGFGEPARGESGSGGFGEPGRGEPGRGEFGSGGAGGFGEAGRGDFDSRGANGSGGFEPGRSESGRGVNGTGGFGESGRGEFGANGTGLSESGFGAAGGERDEFGAGRKDRGANGAGGFGGSGGREEFGTRVVGPPPGTPGYTSPSPVGPGGPVGPPPGTPGFSPPPGTPPRGEPAHTMAMEPPSRGEQQSTAHSPRPASGGAAAAPPGSEWPITPLPGEPPLTLFRGKRMIELEPGMEFDRFGDDEGNLVYAVGTPFSERSLVPEWIDRPYHVYRVRQPVQVLTGAAIPWFDQPGGGTAYLLPDTIGDLVAHGRIMEVDSGDPPRS
jgi:hypothetical protein